MKRILVIDDDEVVRSTACAVLEAAGYQVFEAGDGVAGLRVHREQSPDLVLVDLFMPEMDGLEFIRKLRVECPDAMIVAMSSGGRMGSPDMLAAAAVFGAARTLQKPFDPRALLTALRDVLDEPTP